jgi:hypothetical protein
MSQFKETQEFAWFQEVKNHIIIFKLSSQLELSVERGIWGETPHHIKGGDLSYIYSQYGWSYKETILVNHNTSKAYQLYMESYNQLYIS